VTRQTRAAREIVRVFRIVQKLEEELQAAHGAGDWRKAWEIAIRLRRAIKSSSQKVDDFAKSFRE